jgi:exosortase N
MIITLDISTISRTVNRKLLAGLVLYGLLAVIGLREYVELGSVNFLLGVLALTMVFSSRRGPVSYRFAWVAILFSLLAVLLPVKTFLYFAIGAAMLFMVESSHGSQGALPLLIIGFMAPVFKYFVNIFSFPIRLKLTAWAGEILTFNGSITGVKGNMIYTGNGEFSVDPECMGLNMMTTSLVLGIMLIALYQKKFSKRLALWQTGIFLSIIAVLNIICNLFRIVCLVQFEIMPGTFMHDLLGIACLLIYVVIPAVFIAKFAVARMGVEPGPLKASVTSSRSYKQTVNHLAVAISICVAAFSVVRNSSQNNIAASIPTLENFKVSRVQAGVLKLQNERSLIYIKPIRGFYNTDHHPMICWTGSGYVFEQVRERTVNGVKVYSAVLNNGGTKLHTAWWYDNGIHRTIGQLDWRWDVLRGAKDYSVVNITVPAENELEPAISALQNNSSFNQLLR